MNLNPGVEALGTDPLSWDPMFVNWQNLNPEENKDHALFLTNQYVKVGFVSIETGRMTTPCPEWLLRAFLALDAYAAREEHEKKMKLREDGTYRG